MVNFVVQETIIETLCKFEQFLKKKSERAADILNMLVRRKLSQDSGEAHSEVSVECLLNWQLWPIIIELYASRPQY